MRELRVLAALALGIATVGLAAPVLADDPNDPAMATRAARERDRATIRRLNQNQLAYVRERDAGYAQGWDDYRDAHGDRDAYADSRSDTGQTEADEPYADEPEADEPDSAEAHDSYDAPPESYQAPHDSYNAPRSDDRPDRGYASTRSEYQAAMAEWRDEVAACRAGYYEHCAR